MKRVHVVDALRGFSLLGIFLANLLIFHFSLSGKEYLDIFHISSWNYLFINIVKVGIENSFLPIFAILFGFSMDKLYQSMKVKKYKMKRLKLLFRAFFLILIGIVHGIFIWEGDILFTYGLAMIPLILFISFGEKFYKIVVFIILSLAIVFSVSGIFDNSNMSVNTNTFKEEVKQNVQLMQTGNYEEIHFNLDDSLDPKFKSLKEKFGASAPPFIFMLALLFPLCLFAIGVYFSKSGWFTKSELTFWGNKIFIYLIPVSLLVKSLVLIYPQSNTYTSLSLIFDITLSIGYIVLFKVLYKRYENRIIFKGFESIGKVSLSMYIMQSVIGTLIYYGYGLGLIGKDLFSLGFISFIIIYFIQCYIASIYLKHFRYGPLEYLLRVVTYTKINSKK
ncbi:DUF418 domain-containing protein [Staphylococcus caeli]|uniref:DUF418 domain-containing protein n=1 Tax=Staphylococcus caeli TaxID=2201815 RepID=UPI003F57E8EF